jgi:integrase/recombinase XerD
MDKYLDYIPNILNISRKSALYMVASDLRIRRLKQLTNDLVEKWVGMQSNDFLLAQSINIRISHLRNFLFWCEDHDIRHRIKIYRLPHLKPTEPKRQYFSSDIISACLRRADLRDRVMLSILFDSMMRRFEIAKLRLSEIRGREITYIGKGRKKCTAYINKETICLIAEYVNRYNITDFLFPSHLNATGHIHPQTINLRYKKCFENIGIVGAHTHSARHSGATDLEMNLAPIGLISRLLNHADIRTTRIYTHAYETNLLQERDKYKSIFTENS